MTNSFHSVEVTLGAAVATSGTIVVSYATGKDKGAYENAVGHYISALGAKFTQPDDITISFGAAAATITYLGATTLPAGTKVYVQLEEVGKELTGLFGEVSVIDGVVSKVAITKLKGLTLALIELGSPLTLDADGVCESQNRTGAGSLLINGALSDGDLATSVATFDVPRNVIADSGGADTAVITVTGTDEYGEVVVEAITLNGATAVAGKKAFKTITSVESDGTVTNGMFLGTGDVLGLPIFLPSAAYVLSELQDGAAPTGGTFVAGLAVNTPSTATTADVRGTYDANDASNDSRSLQLLVALPDPTFLGNPQFAG